MSERLNTLARILMGLAAAILVTLAGMAILAVIVVYTRIGDGAITTLNQVVKLAAIFAGVLVCVRPGGRRGFLLGGVTGLIYMALGYGVYCLLDGGLINFSSLAMELLMGAALGAFSGALTANMPCRARSRPLRAQK